MSNGNQNFSIILFLKGLKTGKELYTWIKAKERCESKGTLFLTFPL